MNYQLWWNALIHSQSTLKCRIFEKRLSVWSFLGFIICWVFQWTLISWYSMTFIARRKLWLWICKKKIELFLNIIFPNYFNNLVFSQLAGRWSDFVWLQHPKGEHLTFGIASPRWNANFRKNLDWQNNHLGSGGFWHHWERQGQNPGQGGNSSRSTKVDFCRKTIGK